MCRSVPQMDATFTLTSTSLRPKPGTLTSQISTPGAASGLTTASMVLGMTGVGTRQPKFDSSTGGKCFPGGEIRLLPYASDVADSGMSAFPPPAAARTLNPDALPLAQPHIAFSRQFFHRSILPEHGCVSRRALCPTAQSPGSVPMPVGQQGDFGISQDFDFADDTVPTTMFTVAPASWPQRVLPHAQRVRILQRLRRRVQRIGHVRVYARDARLGRTSAHPTGDGFVIGKRLARARINSSNRKIIHGSRCRCRNPLRNRYVQCPQQDIYNPL